MELVISTAIPRRRWSPSTTASREAVLAWVRGVAPDVRILHAVIDGKAAYAARLTFRGELIELEAIADADTVDPHNAIVRRAMWILCRRMGVHQTLPEGDRRRREREIVAARIAGDDVKADALGRELAVLNEGRTDVVLARSTPFRFERFGGSMFHKDAR